MRDVNEVLPIALSGAALLIVLMGAAFVLVRVRLDRRTRSGARTDLLKGLEVGRVDAAHLLGQCGGQRLEVGDLSRSRAIGCGRGRPVAVEPDGAQAGGAARRRRRWPGCRRPSPRRRGARRAASARARRSPGRAWPRPARRRRRRRRSGRPGPEAASFSRCRHEAPLVTSASAWSPRRRVERGGGVGERLVARAALARRSARRARRRARRRRCPGRPARARHASRR